MLNTQQTRKLGDGRVSMCCGVWPCGIDRGYARWQNNNDDLGEMK